MTNPWPDAILRESDLVFILSQSDPNDQNSEFYKTDYLVNSEDIQKQNMQNIENQIKSEITFGTKKAR